MSDAVTVKEDEALAVWVPVALSDKVEDLESEPVTVRLAVTDRLSEIELECVRRCVRLWGGVMVGEVVKLRVPWDTVMLPVVSVNVCDASLPVAVPVSDEESVEDAETVSV